MYIRRKVFSVLVDETGKEKLFSVNETIKREFAKKEEKKERKLKPLHRYNIAMYKLEGKRGRKLEKQNLEGDWKGTAKSSAKMVPGLAGLGALAGGLSSKSVKGALKGAKLGAIVGTSAGIGSTLATAAEGKLRKKYPKYNKRAEQRLDEMKVAEGKMTKEEYMDKWYKKD